MWRFDRTHGLMGVEGPDDTQKLPSDIDKQLEIVVGLVKADPTVQQEIPDLKETMERCGTKRPRRLW